MVDKSAQGLNVDEQKKNVTAAALAFNELLPIMPLWERYGNNPALEGTRVAKFPADDDPILKNAPYADNFVIMYMYRARWPVLSLSSGGLTRFVWLGRPGDQRARDRPGRPGPVRRVVRRAPGRCGRGARRPRSWSAGRRSGSPCATPGTLKRRLAVGAFEDDRVLGAMLFEYRLTDNLDTVEVEIDVPPQHRRRGIGTALWQWAVTRAAQLGRTIFQTELGVPSEPWPGAEFAARLGFTVEHVEEQLVVPLPYDEVRLDSTCSEAAGSLDGYRLTSWAGVCPPEHQQAYADLHTAMDHDVPTGGMTREVVPWTVEKLQTSEQRINRNYLALVTMAHTLSGEPAGYTLMYLPRADAEHAQQDDTLVLREHRGHNLGTHLKLANLVQLEKHRTTQRFLHTWTALSNASDAARSTPASASARSKNTASSSSPTLACAQPPAASYSTVTTASSWSASSSSPARSGRRPAVVSRQGESVRRRPPP